MHKTTTFYAKIRKTGNSYAITIPMTTIKKLKLKTKNIITVQITSE